ncbi:RodZ domain-containing protein [Chitinivorax sp. B]|uniref:RodZ domain-containing protein n=1 Tax=Chitinivorax sp. B TaxID=2502235 RepID=UPI0010F5A55A|nr:RodZ domain-containing protein [Chitinivorax sp. B]
MSNETTLIDQPVVRQGPGSELKAERLRQSLSIDEVVAKLKLSRRQVEALEADRFDDLPGNTFVKGFIRNYAKLLGLDAGLLIDRVSQLLPADAEMAPVKLEGRMPRITVEPGYSMSADRGGFSVVLMGTVAAVVAGFVFYFIFLRPTSEPELHMAAPATSQEVVEPVDVTTSAPSLVMKTAPSAPVMPPASAPQSVSVAPPMPSSAAVQNQLPGPVSGGTAIKLNFDGESWVDVRDADGRRLISKLFRPGQEEILQGKPPFKLIVGNATQVKLTYNGKPIDLAPYVKVNVARFELN